MTPDSSNTQGQFLIAMPSLAESFFDHALIFMLEHDEDGAMGLIINQPLDISVDEVLSQVGDGYPGDRYPQPVMCGGPVEPQRGFVLHHTRHDHPWQGELPLQQGLSVTASNDILEALAQGQPIGDFLLALGYCGWGPGQLEQELADNAWLTVAADAEVMFNTEADKRLDAVARTLGIRYEQLTSSSGHA